VVVVGGLLEVGAGAELCVVGGAVVLRVGAGVCRTVWLGVGVGVGRTVGIAVGVCVGVGVGVGVGVLGTTVAWTDAIAVVSRSACTASAAETEASSPPWARSETAAAA
jgi:hypothetical protein